MVAPNHHGHIIPPGTYRLDVLVPAENATPKHKIVEIVIAGPWYPPQLRA